MQGKELNYQLFVFPFKYKTVSFHHQADYQIMISPFQKSFDICNIHTMQQLFTKQVQKKTDRNGNVWGVTGYTKNLSHFKTDKFQIEFNDQLVKFNTGFVARIAPKEQSSICLNISLVKLLQLEAKVQESANKIVSSQVLHLNLQNSDSGFNMRRIVFATNQYISFVQIAYQFVKLQSKCLSQQQQLDKVYTRQITDRLRIYRQISLRLSQKIIEFQEDQVDNFKFMQLNRITIQFEQNIIYRDIPNLDYIHLELNSVQEENFDSNVGLNRYELSAKNRKVIDILSEHYQCEVDSIKFHIKSQGKLIQRNIRSLFQRITQLTIPLLGKISLQIDDYELNRVRLTIEESEKNTKMIEDIQHCNNVSSESLKFHKEKMLAFCKRLPNRIGVELRHPYVQIVNYLILEKKNKLNVHNTLTVFIHGYKGNQYDLSKIKSHLNLLLGYNSFYSIKQLKDKASSQGIYKLGEKAANQLNKYLQSNPAYRHINIIGFSLGGLIARAMLPWIQNHKNKLNLLMTIASPHLGIREIQSCLVRVGLCYMRRIAGIQSIRELNSERNEAKSRYLLELAQGKHLQWFKSIILVGSHTDSYVPAYSSLVQYHGQDQITKEIYQRLKPKLSRAVRCIAQLSYNQNLLQVLTKRKSHICFLQDDSFIKYLIVKLRDLFYYDS